MITPAPDEKVAPPPPPLLPNVNWNEATGDRSLDFTPDKVWEAGEPTWLPELSRTFQVAPVTTFDWLSLCNSILSE